jgi:sec-independent protein translocase protein TatA
MTGLASPTHLIILLLIVLLLFGAKRVPEIGGALGKGMRDFKSALSGDDDKPEAVSTTPVAPIAAAPEQPVAAEPTPVAPLPQQHDQP